MSSRHRLGGIPGQCLSHPPRGLAFPLEGCGCFSNTPIALSVPGPARPPPWRRLAQPGDPLLPLLLVTYWVQSCADSRARCEPGRRPRLPGQRRAQAWPRSRCGSCCLAVWSVWEEAGVWPPDLSGLEGRARLRDHIPGPLGRRAPGFRAQHRPLAEAPGREAGRSRGASRENRRGVGCFWKLLLALSSWSLGVHSFPPDAGRHALVAEKALSTPREAPFCQ